MNTFQTLGLEAHLLQAVSDLGFETPSEVQQKAIPILLKEENDLVALAQTGTGKTAAFGFPILQKIDINSRTTQALILSPTRELCLQITDELKLYGKYCKGLNVTAIYGGASIIEQSKKVKRGTQIIVATPGRMKDMISRRLVDISKIDYSVLDEADEMLNMGFFEDVKFILSFTPVEKSTWLFSATMPKEVAVIAKKFMSSPIEIIIGNKNIGSKNVSHEYYMVGSRDRYQALKRLVDANPNIFALVFCRTKRDTQKVAEKLIEDGYNAGSLHGDLSQNQRDLVMKSFRNKQIQMLVATDVAARGIDVEDITHVINYQLPDEIETYTHRSGRTGRAGKTGLSIVIITKSEQRRIKTIEKMIQKQFIKKEIPEGILICEIQLKALAHKINDTEINGEIDNYLEEIKTLFSNTTKDELIKKFFSVEFTRFFNYYNKAKNLNVPKGDTHLSQSDNRDNSARFFINIGKKDGYDWMQMKDFLRDSLGLSQGDVFKVDVKDSFSFFNTEISHMPKVLEFFNDFKLNGRYINVEISEKKDHSRQRRRGKQKHDGYGNRVKSGRGRSTRSSDFKHVTRSSRPRRNRRR